MKRKNEFFIFRKTVLLKRMVSEIMKKRGFYTYTEMFVTLVTEEWGRREA